MLLTKEVEVELRPNNIKWYEEKGYIIPRREDKRGRITTAKGTKILVKVEDLPEGSHVLVDVKCSDCGEIKNIEWRNYLKCVHEDRKYYCKKCNCILNNKKNAYKSKFKNWKISFGYWLIKNLPLRQAVSILTRWDYELNKCDTRDVSYASHGFDDKGYWFKCNRGIHPSELKYINGFTRGFTRGFIKGVEFSLDCDVCNSIGQYLLDTYGEDGLRDYWDYEQNDKLGLDPFKISRGSSIKVFIFCQIHKYHGSYAIMCANFTNGSRCSYCNGNEVHYLDSVGYLYTQVIPIWSEKNEKSPYEYKPSSGKFVWWKCLDGKHDDYRRSVGSSKQKDFRCPECVNEMKESILQNKTRLYLESLGYEVLHEYNCTIVPINPKTNYPLPFDNEIKLINGKRLICEVNGIQHYEMTWFHHQRSKYNNTTAEEEFHKQRLYDRYKRFIAYKNGYEYLEIPYWTDDDKESYKKLINNKLINKEENYE